MAEHKSLLERILHITEGWFLTEPALFCIFCTHELVENSKMHIPIRTGKGKVEYNQEKLSNLTNSQLEECLRLEMVRIFLKHPYERQPLGSRADALHGGSDLVISQSYNPSSVTMLTIEMFGLSSNQTFEWYVRELNHLLEHFVSLISETSEGLISDNGGALDDTEDSADKNQDDALENNNSESKNSQSTTTDTFSMSEDDQNHIQTDALFSTDSNKQPPKASNFTNFNSKEYTELWEEDQEQLMTINYLIQNTIKDWGTLPGKLIESIKTSAEGRIDYRRVMSGFRASVISTKRKLTRIKPNRRLDFAYMGSLYELSTKLLIAIDVSGSVSSKSISHFLKVIERFFKYGISEIDVIQFDANVKKEVVSLREYHKRFQNGFKVTGRGGTNFQPIFDYLKQNNKYDGLVIMTDGYAPKPSIDFYIRAKVLWVLEDEECYRKNQKGLEETGRVCHMCI